MGIQMYKNNTNNSIVYYFIITLAIFTTLVNPMPIGFAIARAISPSANFEQFMSAIGKPSLDDNNKTQSTYNMISLGGFDESTKYATLEYKLSPVMLWKKIFQIVLSSRPTIYGTNSPQIQKYVINQLFRPFKTRLLMHVDLVNSPVSGKNPTSSTDIAQEIVNALMDLSLDGVSIYFNDHNAVRDGSASDWLQSLLKFLKTNSQNQKLITVLIVPPIFVAKLKLFKLPQINSLVDYYILKYYDTTNVDYTSYQSIFQKSMYYPQSSMFQLQKIGTNIDICRTLIAKPAIANGTWNNVQFINQNDLSAAFNQAYNNMGWFAGYANLNMETDKAGTFVKGVLGNLSDQCLRSQNCYC